MLPKVSSLCRSCVVLGERNYIYSQVFAGLPALFQILLLYSGKAYLFLLSSDFFVTGDC